MNKDDRRYRAAYHLLHAHIASLIASDHTAEGAKADAETLLKNVESELNPSATEDAAP